MATLNEAFYGFRPDGSKKERGFLGELRNPKGDAVTEYSIGFDEGDIPSIIPDLHPAELNYILETGNIPESVHVKLLKHADKRKAQGKSPFWNAEQDLVPIQDRLYNGN